MMIPLSPANKNTHLANRMLSLRVRHVGRDYPPPINHPEFFYGFAGVTLAWQVMFLVIASDPVRYRLAMLPAMLEKVGFVVAICVLYAMSRVPAVWLGAASMDGSLFVLFIVAYLRTPKEAMQ